VPSRPSIAQNMVKRAAHAIPQYRIPGSQRPSPSGDRRLPCRAALAPPSAGMNGAGGALARSRRAPYPIASEDWIGGQARNRLTISIPSVARAEHGAPIAEMVEALVTTWWNANHHDQDRRSVRPARLPRPFARFQVCGRCRHPWRVPMLGDLANLSAHSAKANSRPDRFRPRVVGHSFVAGAPEIWPRDPRGRSNVWRRDLYPPERCIPASCSARARRPIRRAVRAAALFTRRT